MQLDERALMDGMKFIVGEWHADYMVNAFSDDLAHIPATDFKTDDGRDFSTLAFTFYEDHSVLLSDPATGKEERGVWEQTDLFEYHYTFESFFDIPDSVFKQNAEKLSVTEGDLVFSIGFLAVALKKTADGAVTEKPDVGDLAGDDSLNAIVGKYAVYKSLAFVNGEFTLFTADEVKADCDKKIAAGEMDEDERGEALRSFNCVYEFTPDHRVIIWMKLPEGVSDEEIRAAVEAGEIGEVRDGYFAAEEHPWKGVDGKYYYDTGEHRESFGETLSSWDELVFNEDGTLPFGSGTVELKRI